MIGGKTSWISTFGAERGGDFTNVENGKRRSSAAKQPRNQNDPMYETS